MVDYQPTKLHKVNGKNDFLLAPKIGKCNSLCTLSADLP